ncbi:MAG: iron-containing alcohol dehydrogenase [Chloroflexota bacterium]
MFNYYIPTRVLFGAGKLNELATIKLPGKKALIVTTNGKSVVRYGVLDRVIKLLKQNGVESVVFDKMLPNPVKSHVMEAAALLRKEGCDFVIGLGGGSAIDSAKSVALMAKNPGDYWDYVGGGTGLGKPVEKGVLPIVAITTTAGTGTEGDPWTVITNEETTEKIGFGTDETFPTLSIVDPELMVTVPPDLTAYQGFDAFCHSAEGYIAKDANPVSDLYALKSIELVARFLPRAVKDGKDMEARTMVALANTLAGFVESTSSCTSEHSMEHALSAYHPKLAHGAGLIMLLVPYFSFFVDKVPARMADMARVMGVNVDALPENERGAAFVHAIETLQAACGVDKLKMSDYGITRAEIPELAKNARSAMGGLFNVDPSPISDAAMIKILEAAYR